MPRDAYRFARGEQVISNTGLPVKLARPYDFFMITEHSDGMGVITDLIAGAPNIMADPDGPGDARGLQAGRQGGDAGNPATDQPVCPGQAVPRDQLPAGQPGLRRGCGREIDPGERRISTTPALHHLFGFEWTSLVTGNNLHRNVIFRDGAGQGRAGRALHDDAAPGQPQPARPVGLDAGLRGQDRRPGHRPFPTTATCPTA